MQTPEPHTHCEAVHGEITQLLDELKEGDSAALDRLFSLVYDHLRQEAHRRRSRRHGAQRQGDETLSTTALVHETYLKLAAAGRREWQDRSHFFAVAARAMRQILVDHARRRAAHKRGSGISPESLDEGRLGVESHAEELLSLDDALVRLAALDQRLAQLVELRFFAGLSVEEAAETLALSERTVKRDWRKARAFLHQLLAPAGAAVPP